MVITVKPIYNIIYHGNCSAKPAKINAINTIKLTNTLSPNVRGILKSPERAFDCLLILIKANNVRKVKKDI